MLAITTRFARLGNLLCVASLYLHGCAATVHSGEPADPIDQRVDGLLAWDDVPPPMYQRGQTSAPLRGSGLTLSRDGKRALVADGDKGQLVTIDLESGQVLQSVQLQPGEWPGQALADEQGHFHVLKREGGRIQSLDHDGKPLRQRPLCAEPRGAALQPGGYLWVACASGDLVQLKAADLSVVQVVPLGRSGLSDLRDVVWAEDHLLISRFRSAEVIQVGADGRVRGTESIPPYTRDEIDIFKPISITYAAHAAWSLLPMQGGKAVMVYQMHSITPLPVYGDHLPIRAFATVMDPQQSKLDVGVEVPGAVLPVASALSTDQRTLLVAAAGNIPFPGSNTIPAAPLLFVSTESRQNGTLAQVVAQYMPMPGDAPFKPIAAAAAADNTFVVLTREPLALWRFSTAGKVISRLPLADPTSVVTDPSRDLFHASFGKGLACASCHLEGGDDGHRWEISRTGLHRTQSLLGTLPDKQRFHWDGIEPDLPSVVKDDTSQFKLSINRAQLSQLADGVGVWMRQQPPAWTPSRWADEQATIRHGQDLFSVGSAYSCASCHSGPRFTNGQTATIKGKVLVVPSLLGVARREPYGNDGRAATLEALLADDGDQAHSVSSPEDRTALAAYLKTL